MNIEDHLGDIICKARTAANASAEDAAAAAGLTVDEFSALEETGKSARRPNLRALAVKVGLHGGKLEGIANGWLPQNRDLGLWRELRPITTAGTGFKVNCYLVWDEVTREAALFDTGFDAQPIFELIDRNKVQLKHLFITHTHADHIAALEPIRSRFPKVKLHSSAKNAPVDQRIFRARMKFHFRKPAANRFERGNVVGMRVRDEQVFELNFVPVDQLENRLRVEARVE